MMKKYIAILATAITLTACSSTEEKQASQLYQEAESAYQNEQYAYASALLDSMDGVYGYFVTEDYDVLYSDGAEALVKDMEGAS